MLDLQKDQQDEARTKHRRVRLSCWQTGGQLGVGKGASVSPPRPWPRLVAVVSPAPCWAGGTAVKWLLTPELGLVMEEHVGLEDTSET